VVKTHNGSTSFKSPPPKPLTIASPQPPSAKKGAYGTSTSNQQPVDHPADGKNEADDKEVPVIPSNPDKKLRISAIVAALTLPNWIR
jgi:hypothetical protein